MTDKLKQALQKLGETGPITGTRFVDAELWSLSVPELEKLKAELIECEWYEDCASIQKIINLKETNRETSNLLRNRRGSL